MTGHHDYAALKAADAALGPLSPEQAAVALNALTWQRPVPIKSASVRKLWTEAGVLARAWVVANDAQAPFGQRWHCKAAYDAIEGGTFSDFDASDPAQLARMQAYFNRLKIAGPEGDKVLTEALEAATLALGFETRPMREQWGFTLPLSYTDIEIARAT
ncbi:hypothetical protein UFOVP326_20 [uncultured Caudovirales phage]|uniref:Uncharacterized protein n=1 Tax=uncultured Caudovirales phage TaxID=2100421 RepID=A0A6J5LX08_9CAUD|nr:hypothetical protein UFOVP326_20 [uncultured Caudovirales phage]